VPILHIKSNFVEDLKSFKWGKEWRAERIWREKRGDGEYFFASLRKDYGIIHNTHAIDLGNKKEDYFWIGRIEKRVGERGPDTDPHSATFGKRVYKEPTTMVSEEFNEVTQKWENIEYKDGKLVYEYVCPANAENIEKFQTLVGNLDNGRSTQLIFLFGSEIIDIQNPDSFFKEGKAVEEFETEYHERQNKDPTEIMTEAVTKIMSAVSSPAKGSK